MGHPADVHLYKNFIFEMERRGHQIKITARDKEVTRYLLDIYGIPYEPVGKMVPGKFNLIKEWISRDIRLINLSTKFKSDCLLGTLNPATAHSAKILGKLSFTFTDTEHAKLANKMTLPFTDVVVTPNCYRDDIGKIQVRYNGYHELAYLHPNYFTPNPEILNELGIVEDDHFIIVRFVSWGASHDVGQHGIRNKVKFVQELEKYGRVLITSEGQLPKDLEKYRIKVGPEKLHDLLYYATLYVGEGATIASECAVLGTHAIYINTLRLGYTDEEEQRYDLVYNYSNPETMEDGALNKAIELLESSDLWEKGKIKREKLLADKIDVTSFMVELVEEYGGNRHK